MLQKSVAALPLPYRCFRSIRSSATLSNIVLLLAKMGHYDAYSRISRSLPANQCSSFEMSTVQTGSLENASPVHRQRRGRDKTDTSDGDGYESDSLVDLNSPASSGLRSRLLRNAPPLQRMSSDYERLVLHSLTQDKVVAFVCACSREVDADHECILHVGKWLDEDEAVAVGDGPSSEPPMGIDNTAVEPSDVASLQQSSFEVAPDVDMDESEVSITFRPDDNEEHPDEFYDLEEFELRRINSGRPRSSQSRFAEAPF